MSGGPWEEIYNSRGRPGARYSLYAHNRHLCDCDEHYDKPESQRGLMTRAEWAAWAKENMLNGYCICNPEKGIVCGQHAARGEGQG